MARKLNAAERRAAEQLAAADPAMAALIELRRSCFASEDFREGIRAFAEKREPQWRGS